MKLITGNPTNRCWMISVTSPGIIGCSNFFLAHLSKQQSTLEKNYAVISPWSWKITWMFVSMNNTSNSGKQKTSTVTPDVNETNRRVLQLSSMSMHKMLVWNMEWASLRCSGNRCQYKSILTEMWLHPFCEFSISIAVSIADLIRTSSSVNLKSKPMQHDSSVFKFVLRFKYIFGL